MAIRSLTIRKSTHRVPWAICYPLNYWRTHTTWVLSLASPTCLAAVLSVLSALAVWWCLLSSYQLSAAELFQLSAHRSGTTCRRMWRLLSRCPYFVSGSKLTCSLNHFLTVSWTFINILQVDLAVDFLLRPLWLIDWLIDCSVFAIKYSNT